MTTARTHLPRGGTPRPKAPTEAPSVPVSAETFGEINLGLTADEPSSVADLNFDPADHTVEDVKEFVTNNPDTANDVLELEENGKDRSTLVEWLVEFEPGA